MQRREFGRRVLQAGALLGLRSISAARLGGVSLSAGACMGVDSYDGALDPGGSGAALNGAARSVVIIGSGYGAAVAALRFTQRGIPVTLLERGRLWNEKQADGSVFCTPFDPDGRAMWFKDRTEVVVKSFAGIVPTSFPTPVEAGAVDVSGPVNMRAFRGAGVGGGSLVNLAIFVTPEREVLQARLPGVGMNEMFNTYYPRAKATLRASQLPERLFREDIYQYARVGAAAAQAAGFAVSRCVSGYDYDYLARELQGLVPASASAGEAGFGNNYGKNSLDKSYLADAMATGLLTIRMLTEVTRIRAAQPGGYILDTRQIDIHGKVLKQEELHCSHLIVGAGSIGSSEMLVRARDRGDLANLNEHVGTQWGPNGDIFVARDLPIWNPSGAQQCGVPGAEFRTRDQNGKHVFSMFIPFPAGLETYLSLSIVMPENLEAGHFQYDSTADRVNLLWYPEQNEPAVKSTRFVFDKINRAAGTSYNESMFGGPPIGDIATYHPVGGIPLGTATDPYGRIVGHPGLYVMDSSLIPVGICANPALTTAALAERNVERILAEDFNA
jgi:cholesterol oxidase